MARKITKTWLYDGVSFAVKGARPKDLADTDFPVRVTITPLDPRTGKKVTKRQLRGQDSDGPAEEYMYGTSEEQIHNELFAGKAAALVREMIENNLIPGRRPDAKHDLMQLAGACKEEFFGYAVLKNRWKQNTVEGYRAQYDYMMADLDGITAETFGDDQYLQFQLNVIDYAYESSREGKPDDWEYGDDISSSGSTRLYLAYLLFHWLKDIQGIRIPAKATEYKGKPSHEKRLLVRVDQVRHYLPGHILELYQSDEFIGAAIMNDTGIRLGECVGLLWGSLKAVCGSQGWLHYLEITGQASIDTGKRTEITKTEAGYRYVPLSFELGQRLMQRKKEMLEKYGRKIEKISMFAVEENGRLNGDAKIVKAYRSSLETFINGVLRKPEIIQYHRAMRLLEFLPEKQDEKMYAGLSSHSLRRDAITRSRCSNLEIAEIYRQAGHANTEDPLTGWRGMTSEEVYAMCLMRLVSGTGQFKPRALKYNAAAQPGKSEVPCCDLELTLEPGQCVELRVEDTEPNNRIYLQTQGLQVKQVYQMPGPERPVCYGLLSRPEMTHVVECRKLFDFSDGEAENESNPE